MPDRFVQPGAPVVEEDPPVRPDKLVKPEDTGEDAMGRPLPVEFPDDSSGKPDLDEDATPEKLQVPAGERPAQGGVPCEDAPGFLDERHEPCGAWASYQIGCHRATEDIGFSQDGENALVRNCRKSCGLCGSEPEDALASEADNTTPQLTTPETAAPETISPQATTPETTTPCDCDNVETETVHVKITAVLTPTAPARGGSLAQREARGGGRRDGSGCDCAGGRSGSAPPAHVELAGPENLPASAVAGALAAAVAAPDAESTTDV
ncbi:unnamed protein product [Prorocentrum cordatum]|uniref:ShKT domain-containing protein n=1 Tax=Prorocentrum cordatum TaxID=2364126 RepID=A0ABN9U276_9DINO|nr:unnamed protein product [Polarella glacialis]